MRLDMRHGHVRWDMRHGHVRWDMRHGHVRWDMRHGQMRWDMRHGQMRWDMRHGHARWDTRRLVRYLEGSESVGLFLCTIYLLSENGILCLVVQLPDTYLVQL